jgi:flagellar biosynthesis/type III secretory pathway chaperone
MTPTERVEAAQALANIIAQENEALQRLDFLAAAKFLPAKEAALARLTQDGPVESVTDRAPHVIALGQHLTTLAEENRTLLERAITVQTRIVGIILRSVADAAQPGNYSADGRVTTQRRSCAVALSARA